MKSIRSKAASVLILILLLSGFQSVSADVSIPHPFIDFSGIFADFDPECINGALVVVIVSMEPFVPLLLLLPYEPISPIQPVFKSWGPILGASTLGNFQEGGACVVAVTGGTITIPVEGTIIQIGTSAEPTPWYSPLLI